MSTIQTTDSVQTLIMKSGAIVPIFTGNRTIDINAVVDWKSLKKFITHESTSTTKAIKQIQKELAMSLLFISEDIKRAKLLQYDEKDVQKIYDVFRNHIQRSYQIGIAYVNNIFNSKGFIDSEDLKIIKFLSEYYTQVFLNSIDKILTDPKFLLNIDRSILDINEDRMSKSSLFNYLAHSVSATFQALQVSTIVKTLVLAYDNSQPSPSPLANGEGSNLPNIEFRWVNSMSERNSECTVCGELDGTTWALTNWGTIPLIPHQVHPHCRCRIMITHHSD